METVRLQQRLRPMKFLFLVSQDDKVTVELAFKLNTVLWGGMFNPVVALEWGDEVIPSIFEASHADRIVNLSRRPWPSSLINKYSRRLVEFEGYDGLVEQEAGKYSFRLGGDMRPFFDYYWEKEGRHRTVIQQGDQNDYVLVEGATLEWQQYALLECGLYPDSFSYDYTLSYCKATSCRKITLDESTISSISFYDSKTPLTFTLAKTRYHFSSNWRGGDSHIIYIGDLSVVRDWIESWNLRCFGSRVLFVPWDRIPLFADQIRRYLKEGFYPINDQVENYPLVQKASTLAQDKFESAIASITDLREEKISIGTRDWLPAFDLAYPPRLGRRYGPPPIEAPIGTAYEQEDLIPVTDGQLEFKLVLPEFLSPYKDDRERSWSIAVSGWGRLENDLWLKLPCFSGVEDMLRANHHIIGMHFRLSTRENLIVFRDSFYTLDIVTLRLPSTFDVFKAIFSDCGITFTDYSEKGRYASGIEEAFGGIWGGAMILRDRGVRELLQRLSQNNGEYHLPRNELEKIIGEKSQMVRNQAGWGGKVTPVSIVDGLITKKVLRPGLEFKCQHCYRQGWYHISQFGDTFKCHYCYTEQQVPVFDRKEWRYRSSGLFATQDVGYGSLPVICTSLFFRTKFMHDLRHVYSFNFVNPDGSDGELDLALVRMGFQDEPEITVCECKSTDFSSDDFSRLEKIALAVSDSVVCLATLKDKFTDGEKNWARGLWKAGREVILLARDDLESAEMKLEGVEGRLQYFHDFVGLAHSTRVKYLGDVS